MELSTGVKKKNCWSAFTLRFFFGGRLEVFAPNPLRYRLASGEAEIHDHLRAVANFGFLRLAVLTSGWRYTLQAR
jgi:hypothetical protein